MNLSVIIKLYLIYQKYTMRKIFPDYFMITLKGLAMGAADVVPGVSGGTVAFIAGIYEELIDTINKVDFGFFKNWKNEGLQMAWAKINGSFLVALLSGIAISILSFAKLIVYLLKFHPIVVWSFFFGLIIASIFFMTKQMTKWQWTTVLALLIGAVIAYYITIARPTESPDSFLYLFISGFIAIIAMILPGISGSFILLLMGSYETVMNTINNAREGLFTGNFDLFKEAFLKIVVFGLGCIVGLKLFSKVLKWMFEHHKNTTLAVLIGFMVGSLNKVWPWKKILETRINSKGEEVTFLDQSIWPSTFEGDPKIFYAVVFAVIGFLLIFMLEFVANKLIKTKA
jgi:putative membrane protein